MKRFEIVYNFSPGKYILPFVNTPANILSQAVKATPLGSIRLLFKSALAFKDSNYEYSKKEVIEDVSSTTPEFNRESKACIIISFDNISVKFPSIKKQLLYTFSSHK
jgi:hypothetical protein